MLMPYRGAWLPRRAPRAPWWRRLLAPTVPWELARRQARLRGLPRARAIRIELNRQVILLGPLPLFKPIAPIPARMLDCMLEERYVRALRASAWVHQLCAELRKLYVPRRRPWLARGTRPPFGGFRV